MLSKTTLRLLGIAFILLSATHGSPVVAAITVACAIVLVLWSNIGDLPLTTGSEIKWAAAAAILLVTGALGRPIGSLPGSLVEYRLVLIALGVLACATAALSGNRPTVRRGAVVLAMSVGVLVLAISVWFEWSSTLGTDVYHAHRLAGAALVSGENPYTDAVTFADGNPFSSSDRVIEGYPYPPVSPLDVRVGRSVHRSQADQCALLVCIPGLVGPWRLEDAERRRLEDQALGAHSDGPGALGFRGLVYGLDRAVDAVPILGRRSDLESITHLVRGTTRARPRIEAVPDLLAATGASPSRLGMAESDRRQRW